MRWKPWIFRIRRSTWRRKRNLPPHKSFWKKKSKGHRGRFQNRFPNVSSGQGHARSHVCFPCAPTRITIQCCKEHPWREPTQMGTRNRPMILPACFLLIISCLVSSGFGQRTKAEKQKANAAAQSAEPVKTEDSQKNDNEDPNFKGMKYRLIGPFRGGRSLTASGIPGDPTTYYFGATGGGVWKSIDGANTWSPIFDKDGAPAIGSIAVSVSDPNVVYVGTGEACIRGNISHGDGVWKSVDAGKSWKSVGLKDSRSIGRVIVNPHNSD